MEPKYIIVQAGGRGSRMEKITENKPKALVPVNNLPIIFHLFEKYPDRKFIIIGDYKYSVLEKYLRAFAKVDYTLVRPTGGKGSCAGLPEALGHVPSGEPFVLIWCDLILADSYEMPDHLESDLVGITREFPCRYQYEDGRFVKREDTGHGVVGFFIFRDKRLLGDVPSEGELVVYLMESGIPLEEHVLEGLREYGTKAAYDRLPVDKCRPFNHIETDGERFIKMPVNEQGRELAEKECAWYRAIQDKGIANLPKIFDYSPLCMEFISGRNAYECGADSIEAKRDILRQIVMSLKAIHDIGSIPCDRESFRKACVTKTIERLSKVRDLIPFAGDEYVTINGKRCVNVLHRLEELERQVMEYCPERFTMIHGDCTFSNMIIRDDHTPVLIDPRGYYGNTLLYGDPAYDWAKVYYSLCSNYDRFNLKDFTLFIGDEGVELEIASNGFEMLEDDFFELVGSGISRRQMKLYLCFIWLSLTTYALTDYDSIGGAFYNGLRYYDEAMMEEGSAV